MPQFSYTPHPLSGGHLLEVCEDHVRLTKGSKPATSVNYDDVRRARYFDIVSPRRHSLGVALETGQDTFLVEYTQLGSATQDVETYKEGIKNLLQSLQAKRPDLDIVSGPSTNALFFLFLFFCVIGAPMAFLTIAFLSEQDARQVGLAMLGVTLPVIWMAWTYRPWQSRRVIDPVTLRPKSPAPKRKQEERAPMPAEPWMGR